MKQFAAYYPGVYGYSDTSPNAHPWFPKGNAEYWKMYQSVVNLYEWEGTAGKPAVKGDNGAVITLENLADFDMRQTDSAVEYIKQHAKDGKPFFMDVNFMKMHQPTSPNKMFAGKSHLGNYSDSMLELDYNIGRIMDAIRAEAPDTIVIITADNGAWQDAWPDAGTHPFRGEKGSPFEAGWRVPGIMWAPGKIPAGLVLHEMMSHMDVWPTTAAMVGLNAPPKGEMMDNNGKPIYFDGIDNSAYVTGKAKHSARNGWIYIDGENFSGVRADVALDPEAPDVKIAWKTLYTSKDTWMGPTLNMGAVPFDLQPDHGPLREIRHDVQRRGRDPQPDLVAGPLRRHGQWLGPFADRHSAHGVQQVDHQVSEHRTLPGRSLERHDPESAEPEEPIALRSDEGAEDHRSRRGLDPAAS